MSRESRIRLKNGFFMKKRVLCFQVFRLVKVFNVLYNLFQSE